MITSYVILALFGIFILFNINYKIGEIMTTQTELVVELGLIKDQLLKASAEIVAHVQALEVAVANSGAVTPEVQAAVDALKAVAQGLDDLNPDPVPTPVPTPVDPTAPV